ncbi:MAG: 16S rRNA (guanine(966)-N(2))-methyltransferase RsmD [Alphaproteobacteria bacterium]|nr:16S rRNA (guanine(966)-N(2))-methyltransferase RsmD [Alphaproteobacteria bacterium]
MAQTRGQVRIIAGRFGGRSIRVPPGRGIRPTGARVREALFSILDSRDSGLADAHVLDACAGSGALGFEALSRGASHVTFLDADRRAVDTIAQTARDLGAGDRVTARRGDATRPPRAPQGPVDLVLLDPPYDSDIADTAPNALAAAGWIEANTLVVIETRKTAPVVPGTGFVIADHREYGDTSLFFLKLSG